MTYAVRPILNRTPACCLRIASVRTNKPAFKSSWLSSTKPRATFDDCRIFVSRRAAAEQFDQQTLFRPSQFSPDRCFDHRRCPF
jgi:hypothetical protein